MIWYNTIKWKQSGIRQNKQKKFKCQGEAQGTHVDAETYRFRHAGIQKKT